MDDKKMTGKEARYVLRQRRVSLTDLASRLGISPQALGSRLNAETFSHSRQLEINKVMGEDIFDVSVPLTDRQPILDIRVSAGTGVGLEGDEHTVTEYVSVPAMNGCIGITVYGDSMYPTYSAGDVIFVRPIPVLDDIDYGRTYLIITQSDRLLKNILPSKHDATCLRLQSINESTNRQGDRLYPDRDIPKEYILYLYKVVGSLRREQI
jgi:hypothetical protein